MKLSARETAARLHYSMSSLRLMRLSGQIQGEKIGRDWFYEEVEVARVAALPRRPVGFPKGKTWQEIGRTSRRTRTKSEMGPD